MSANLRLGATSPTRCTQKEAACTGRSGGTGCCAKAAAWTFCLEDKRYRIAWMKENSHVACGRVFCIFRALTRSYEEMDNRWPAAFKPRTLWHLIKEAGSDWIHDRAPRLGAALAYYTVFSLVPFLVVIISVIGLVF